MQAETVQLDVRMLRHEMPLVSGDVVAAPAHPVPVARVQLDLSGHEGLYGPRGSREGTLSQTSQRAESSSMDFYWYEDN